MQLLGPYILFTGLGTDQSGIALQAWHGINFKHTHLLFAIFTKPPLHSFRTKHVKLARGPTGLDQNLIRLLICLLLDEFHHLQTYSKL
jgi:hypothetical protein